MRSDGGGSATSRLRDRLSTSPHLVEATLLGTFLLSTGTVLPLVFVAAYLVRVADAAGRGASLPAFERWRALAALGLRATGVWLVSVIPPLFVLAAWIEAFAVVTDGFSRPADVTTLNAAVGLVGLLVGGSVAARDLLVTLQGVVVSVGALDLIVPPYGPLDAATAEPVLLGAFLLTLAVSQYVAAAVVVSLARTRSLRETLTSGVLGPTLTDTRFAGRFPPAVVLLVVGAVGPVVWNDWRAGIPVSDQDPLTVGALPVLPFPTDVGVLSTAFLLSASAVNFVCLVAAFSLLGGFDRPASEPAPAAQAAEESGVSGGPGDDTTD